MAKCPFESVEEYLNSFEGETLEKLGRIRQLILETAPNAEEKLSWGMPAYYQKGFLVQFAGFKKHIGFYTNPTTIQHFKEDLKDFKTNEKNTMQLPLNRPLPEDLLKKMILFRLAENLNKKK